MQSKDVRITFTTIFQGVLNARTKLNKNANYLGIFQRKSEVWPDGKTLEDNFNNLPSDLSCFSHENVEIGHEFDLKGQNRNKAEKESYVTHSDDFMRPAGIQECRTPLLNIVLSDELVQFSSICLSLLFGFTNSGKELIGKFLK